MKLTDVQIAFIKEHAHADVNALLLGAARYPGMDLPFLADQILARRQVREKLPSWYQQDAICFPSRLAAEQCSSEVTARYKQRLVAPGVVLCDLTGGMGVDAFFFSKKVANVFYIERFAAYCEAARTNFEVLGADNIEVLAGDALQYWDRLPSVDVFYIDPARRGGGNKRVFALQDCEPDLLSIKAGLLQKAPLVIAKISPMADLLHTLSLLPETVGVHVVSVRNECKELLFLLAKEKKVKEPVVRCVNFTAAGEEQAFSFVLSDERTARPAMAACVKRFLYEPNASLLKAGAFKSVAVRWGLDKLHVNSHLYTADYVAEDFPGRRFRVEEVIDFTAKNCSGLSNRLPQANITVRNFPLSVDNLRKRTKIKEGGDVYLFATTLGRDEKLLIRTSKI